MGALIMRGDESSAMHSTSGSSPPHQDDVAILKDVAFQRQLRDQPG